MLIVSKKQASFKTEVVFVVMESKVTYPDFSAEKGKLTVVHEEQIRKIIVGLGKEKDVSLEILRCACALAIAKLKDLKIEAAAFNLPLLASIDQKEMAFVFTEGIILANYKFDKYKSEKSKALSKIEIISDANVTAMITRAQKICDATNFVRDLVNENAHVMTPEKLASEGKNIASKYKLKINILDEKAIKKEKLGLLEAVGAGSPNPPRLFFIHYNGNKKSKKQIAIIGKGITFDTGGINLKSSKHINDMKSDMAGAATVLGVIKVCAELKLAVNVIGVVSAAYNAIDGKAYIPGDIYTSYSGKTVSVNNTDAEGRLVLADAIAYTVKKYKPEVVVDLATLTGAIGVSLAHLAAGLFSNNDQLIAEIKTAAENTYERVWHMPLYDEFKESIKGDISDLINISNLDGGGASTAAAFLESFVEKTPWVHLDIAGTAFNSKQVNYMPKFATGYGVRLLVDWLKNRK